MPSNKAAYIVAEKVPLEIRPAPRPEPEELKVIVRNRAVAINPVDAYTQFLGASVVSWCKYPYITGYDVAGEVQSVGSGVTKFKVGDRVAGVASNTFQELVTVNEYCLTGIPDSITFEQASVFPMCLGVAAKSLFHPEYLAFDLPTPSTKPNGKVVLVWGGSTSVGSNAIQLAKAAGFEVFTTASPARFDYVKQLGASQVFDYNSPTIRNDILTAVKGRTVAGTIANGGLKREDYPVIVETCAAVALSSPENGNFIPLTMVPNFPLPVGVRTKFVEPVVGDKELGTAIFNDYLPRALADGSFIPAPEPQVAGHSLEELQHGMDLVLKAGAPGKKVVVTL